MKIKSLLIGSAALMTVSTGSYAADAVVMAAPEPVEYVKVCDVYGAGYFYIPGTETCLKIGGYIRDDIGINAAQAAVGMRGYRNLARFTPTFDVRSETEWGTLRGYAEIEMSATSNNVAAPAAVAQAFNIAHAFIEVQGASGTFLIGRTYSPYARFLSFGVDNFNNNIGYGFNNTSEISYTFNGGNGFSAIIALVEPNAAFTHTGVIGGASAPVKTFSWATNVEGGINFKQGWGSVGAIVGYDAVNANWGAKGVARFKGGNGFSASLHVFYASGLAGTANAYRVSTLHQNWSVAAGVGFAASPKVAFNLYGQWFDSPITAGAWAFAANVHWTPVQNLLIRPEIRYTQAGAAPGVWDGVVRFQRSF